LGALLWRLLQYRESGRIGKTQKDYHSMQIAE
jgi:hypothetical protein